MNERDQWTIPGAFEVAPGVHRIPLPLPDDALKAVNVYAVAVEQGLVVIDAGWALDVSKEALARALATIGYELGDIQRFLVTHHHRDHYTQAVAIRREFGSRVSLGIGERPSIELVQRVSTGSLDPWEAQFVELRRAGAQDLIERLRKLGDAASGERMAGDGGDWESPDDWLDGETTIALRDRQLVALPTPGHTQGHFVFADTAAGVLFAGDHVLPHITPSIGFEGVTGGLPLRDFLDSLALVRRLPDMVLLPAHGPVAPSVHARVDELLAHHDQRLNACVAAVLAGAGTAFETARALPWTRRDIHFDQLHPFHQMLATTETSAHTRLLAHQGRLTWDERDGVECYEVTRA